MNQLADVEREQALWHFYEGLGIREVVRELGFARNTLTNLVVDFYSVLTESGFVIREEFGEWDRYMTRRAQPLGGKMRKPRLVPTPLPLIWTRAALTQSLRDEKAQVLLSSALPLIRSAYYPRTRAQLIDAEARAQGSLAPVSCRHCGGSYGWHRHDAICVRHGLA